MSSTDMIGWGIAIIYCVPYATALVYGWMHQDDPFWRGFCDPFNIRGE